MSTPTWRDHLQDAIPVDCARERDNFEAQMHLRKKNKSEEKTFAELRLRRGALVALMRGREGAVFRRFEGLNRSERGDGGDRSGDDARRLVRSLCATLRNFAGRALVDLAST